MTLGQGHKARGTRKMGRLKLKYFFWGRVYFPNGSLKCDCNTQVPWQMILIQHVQPFMVSGVLSVQCKLFIFLGTPTKDVPYSNTYHMGDHPPHAGVTCNYTVVIILFHPKLLIVSILNISQNPMSYVLQSWAATFKRFCPALFSRHVFWIDIHEIRWQWCITW